ncbi:cupin domain-containing protein [Brevibacillus borstelensis]|uniref:cupin domain-containing protein n=1 Tax=Brevibacillus borstelensis TaxID=45462 RepID=UPI00203B842E|nr:cupin domain-containing protein [Brevibacillus borstelensis]MCM3621937.1 cupin domain-containing protein [Brevibacillus borstelensis]
MSIGNQLGGNAQLRGRLRLQLDKHRIRTGVASGQKAPPIPPITEEKNIKAPPNKVAAAWASVSVIEAADNISVAHQKGVKEYLVVTQGRMRAVLGECLLDTILEEGDSLYFEADIPHRFINVGDMPFSDYPVNDSTNSRSVRQQKSEVRMNLLNR